VVNRRTFIQQTLTAGTALLVPRAGATGAPAIVLAQQTLPSMPQGVAVGDVADGRAVMWSRADRPARMFVEYSTTASFRDVRRVRGPAALESSDFTARVLLDELPDGQRMFYRVLFQDLTDLRRWSEPSAGSFATSSASGSRNVRLAWSADTVGQGWGINPEWGGLRLYETMRRLQPDAFIHCGDTVYADQPLLAEVTLDDGRIWKNLVTPAKSKAAETVAEFRGNYQYNLLDDHMRAFHREVSQVVTWDDHEVRDNWYETRDLSRDERYQVKSTALLAARARQAFFEYNPIPQVATDAERIYRSVRHGAAVEIFVLDMRSYRGANTENVQRRGAAEAALLGPSQLEWLKQALARSTSTWKVIASDLPIGLVVRDGPTHFEAIANAEEGAPLGREGEIADVLRFIRDRGVANVVWITGDVHYCAAHHYDPARARFTEFSPFWEFVAGPLNAGTFGPNELDGTFGPEVKFNGVPAGMKANRPPSEGLQFFGTLTIDGTTKALTAALHNLEGRTLFSVELESR